MSTITFDTHEFFNELKSAGFSELQAETITKLQKAAVSSTLEQARHEYDLDNLVTNKSLDNRLREMELGMDARFLDLENKPVKWAIGLALGQVAVIAALYCKRSCVAFFRIPSPQPSPSRRGGQKPQSVPVSSIVKLL